MGATSQAILLVCSAFLVSRPSDRRLDPQIMHRFG